MTVVSLIAVTWCIGGSIIWSIRDLCCNCIKCCNKRKNICCLKCICVCPMIFFTFLFLWALLSANDSWDRGYIIADIEYTIDYIDIILNKEYIFQNNLIQYDYIDNYEYDIYNITMYNHFGLDYNNDLNIQCIDYFEYKFNIDDIFNDSISFPVICFEIINKKLQFTFIYDIESRDDDEIQYYQTNNRLNFEVNISNQLYGPDDFSICKECDKNYLLSNTSWSIQYKWTNIFNCDNNVITSKNNSLIDE